MGRSSVSQRGFVSAVLTLAFVAIVVGLAVNFFISRNENQEVLARRKAETDFAKMGKMEDVADSFLVISSSACVAELSYDSVTNTYTPLGNDCGTGACGFDFCNYTTSELDELIPRGQNGTYRLLRVNNSNPNFSINEAFPTQVSSVGAGPTESRPADTACFSGDTLVLTGMSGLSLKYKRIDSLKVGDYVLSVDHVGPEASMIGSMSVAESMKLAALKSIKSRLKPVRIATIHKHTPPNEGAVKISLNTGEIVTTMSHPFMVYGRGWTSLGFFENKGSVVSLDGGLNSIQKIDIVETPIELYNITLQESSTYFVHLNGLSNPTLSSFLWVHNAVTEGKQTGGTL